MADVYAQPDPQGPIGVFDSGLGGISVLRELMREMPGENYIFFGDSANAPYGVKTVEEIRKLTLEHAEFLRERGVKALVIACNTATSAAIKELRKRYEDIPVIGIEPALKPAVLEHPSETVVVLATPVTLKEEKFRNLMQQYSDRAEILCCPCPKLVEFVEQGRTCGAEVETYLKEALKDVLDRKPAAAVLGCTHFPFAKEAIRNVFGDGVELYDGGAGTARHTRNRLEEMGLLYDRHEEPEVEIMNSSGDFEMIERAYAYLDM